MIEYFVSFNEFSFLFSNFEYEKEKSAANRKRISKGQGKYE